MPSPYIRKGTGLKASQRNGKLGGTVRVSIRPLTAEQQLILEQQAHRRGNVTKARYGKEFYRAIAKKRWEEARQRAENNPA